MSDAFRSVINDEALSSSVRNAVARVFERAEGDRAITLQRRAELAG